MRPAEARQASRYALALTSRFLITQFYAFSEICLISLRLDRQCEFYLLVT